MKESMKFPVYEFRPIADDFSNYFRYNNGNWIKDDGEYDLVFCYGVIWIGVNLPHRENILWSYCKDMNWMAKVNQHPDNNPWHYMLKDSAKGWGEFWKNRYNHPNIIANDIARNYVSKNTGCANGTFVDFNVCDKVIKASKLRIRDTKEIVKVPKKFNCMYCGEIEIK